MFRNLIFDWSGTLVDDLGPVIEATNVVFAGHGLKPFDREGFRRHFRLPYVDFYGEHLPGVPMAELEACFRAAFARAKSAVTVLPHAREKLAWCEARGIRAFVLTSMDPDAFQAQLVGFGLEGAFEATYAGVVDKREMIHRILATHGLDPAHTAFVGDMIHDVETARHGGVASVAVLTGYTHPEVLALARPDLTVPDLAVLRELMERSWRSVTTSGVLAPGPSADRIQVQALRVNASVGVPDEERAVPQELSIDLVLEPCRSFEGLADNLAATVDYHAVVLRVEEIVAARPRKLLETLAVDIARQLLDDYPLRAVEVSIDKFILPRTRAVGVRVRRERDGPASGPQSNPA